jgi:hypothetical protein
VLGQRALSHTGNADEVGHRDLATTVLAHVVDGSLDVVRHWPPATIIVVWQFHVGAEPATAFADHPTETGGFRIGGLKADIANDSGRPIVPQVVLEGGSDVFSIER